MITARPTPLIVRGSRPGHATQYESPSATIQPRTRTTLLEPDVVAEAVRIAKQDRLHEDLAAYAVRKGAPVPPPPVEPFIPPAGVFDPAKCGEYRGYKQHCKYRTPICDPCMDARRRYDAERRAKGLDK